MNAIVVVDQNWGIGKDGGLLVHLPGELKYYKEKTIGNLSLQAEKRWNPSREASRFREGKTSC